MSLEFNTLNRKCLVQTVAPLHTGIHQALACQHVCFCSQDMHGISSETVRCILPVEDAHVPTPPPYGGSVTAPCLVCGLLGYIGNLFFPIYLSYKLAKANDPERLELSHSGGRRDDPRGEQNRVIAAPPSHTSV